MKRCELFKQLTMLTCIVIFSYALLGGNIKAKWYVIDDHEIFHYIGQKSKLDYLGWWDSMKNSEVFKPGVSLRYRPIYYALRFAEMVLWGKNPIGWYLFRLGILIIFLFLTWYLLRKFFSDLVAIFLVLFLFTMRFWPDLILRLGPAETYALVGLPLLAISLIRLWSYKSDYLTCVLLMIGSLLTVGVKENFIFILLPISLIAVRLFFKKKLTFLISISLAISLVFNLFIFWAFFRANQMSGSDIYGQNTSIMNRFQLLSESLTGLQDSKLSKIIFFGIPTLSLGLYIFRNRFNKMDRDSFTLSSVYALLWFMVLVLIWISQYVFYDGNWPRGNRYDYPGVLVKPLLMTIFIWLVINFTRIKKLEWLTRCINLLIVGCLIYVVASDKYSLLRTAVNKNIERTNQFTENIETIVTQLKSNNNMDVIFISHAANDYEPIESTRRILRSYGVKNKISVKSQICDRPVKSEWEGFLVTSVCNLSKGDTNYYSLNDLNSDKYYCIGFWGSEFGNDCKYETVLFEQGTNYELY